MNTQLQFQIVFVMNVIKANNELRISFIFYMFN